MLKIKDNENWKWKSLIIDFSKLSKETIIGSSITKIEWIFRFLNIPDERIHNWKSGWYSSEYNEALEYAFELDLVEKVSDE